MMAPIRHVLQEEDTIYADAFYDIVISYTALSSNSNVHIYV